MINYELFATRNAACTLIWCKATCWLQEACWRYDVVATFISPGVSAMKNERHSRWQGRNTQLHDCSNLRCSEIYTASGSYCSSLRYTEIYTASGSSVSELRRYWTVYLLLFSDESLENYSSKKQLHCAAKYTVFLTPPSLLICLRKSSVLGRTSFILTSDVILMNEW